MRFFAFGERNIRVFCNYSDCGALKDGKLLPPTGGISLLIALFAISRQRVYSE